MAELIHRRRTIYNFIEMCYLQKEITEDNIVMNFMPYYLTLKQHEKIIYNKLNSVLSLYFGDRLQIAKFLSKDYEHNFLIPENEKKRGIVIISYKSNVRQFETWYNVRDCYV